MRPASSYPRFTAEVKRDTTVEHLRRKVGAWMGYGLCQPVAIGAHCDRWFVNAAMRCTAPVRFHWIARDSFGSAAKKPLVLEILFRCRSCKECERSNSRQWAARCGLEYERAARTWFGTLTLSPEQHALVDQWVADANLWPERSRLSDEQYEKALFRARASIVGDQMNSWLAIVRDVAYLRQHKRELIRYLLVAERHASRDTAVIMRNRPHYHIVLHEKMPGAAFCGDVLQALQGHDNGELVCRKYKAGNDWKSGVFAADDALARKAWVLGHTKFQYCVNAKAAFYVCKYLYQSDMGRVRASLHYGSRDQSE